MRAYHRSLSVRCVSAGTLLALLTLGVMAATDEGGSTPAMRAARLCAFTPALAALGASATLELARSRGELRALEALGVSPWRTAFGASLGALLLGVLAVALLCGPWTDVSALFPAVTAQDTWLGNGLSFVDRAHGVAVASNGALSWVGSLPSAQVASPGRAAAVSCVAPLALVTPAWTSAPRRLGTRALEVSLTFALTVYLLHAAAAGRGAAWMLPLAAMPFVVGAALGHRSGRP